MSQQLPGLEGPSALTERQRFALELIRARENELHPGVAAWDRTAATFGILVAGHNELLEQLTWLYNEVLNLQEVVRSLGGVVE